MLTLAFVFLAIAIIAGIFGFTGIAEVAGGISKFFFVVFFTLFIMLIALIATGH